MPFDMNRSAMNRSGALVFDAWLQDLQNARLFSVGFGFVQLVLKSLSA